MAKEIPVHPLDNFLKNIDFSGNGDVKVEVRREHGIVQLFAANGQADKLCDLLSISSNAGTPTTNRTLTSLPISPGQWLCVSAKPDENTTFTDRLKKRVKQSGHVSEQSDARVIFRISGEKATELMQKECRLDLRSPALESTWCASTQMAHIGVILHQVNQNPIYDIYVYSGFAEEFAQWLLHAGRQLEIKFLK